ncbi:MAG TPA: T9SS type A sorting domain-containing protein, partial [Ignavibacteria bacterium]
YISSNTYIYKTTNGGSNWTQVFFQGGGFINAIGYYTGSGLFIEGDPVGGRWSLWKSTNLGTNWDSTGLYLPQAGTEAGWNNAMFFTGSKIWIGTNNTRLYYSSNGGNNWVIQNTSPEVNSYAVYFTAISGGLEGLIAGATMFRTSNGGFNWTSQSALGTGNFGGITGQSYFGNQTYYVRSDNKIYYALGINNFNVDYTAPAGNYRHISGGWVGGPFWAVRDNGGISYRAAFGGINPIGSEIPNEFSLHQNFPNPFNPSTSIRFDLPKSSFVKLTVYTSLGSEVAALVNENLIAGSYEYKWNASDRISSGIYYYSLEAGSFRETKKMILIK